LMSSNTKFIEPAQREQIEKAKEALTAKLQGAATNAIQESKSREKIEFGKGKIPLQEIASFPTHIWKFIISLFDAPILAQLSLVCSAFYCAAKPHIDQLGGKLFGHWRAEFYMVDWESDPAVLNLTIRPGSVIVGYGITIFANVPAPFKIFGSRLGNVFSLFLYFQATETIFSNQIVTFEYDPVTETALLKGSFVTLLPAGTVQVMAELGYGKLIGKMKSDSYQPVVESLCEDALFDFENPHNTTRLFSFLPAVLHNWEDAAILALLGKWVVTLLFTQKGVEQRVEITFLLNEHASYGASGTVQNGTLNKEPLSQCNGDVLATMKFGQGGRNRNIVGFSMHFADIREEGIVRQLNFAMTSAIAQIVVTTDNKTSLIDGSFVSRSETETEIHGKFLGERLSD